MSNELIVMVVIEDYFAWQPELVVNWLTVFQEMTLEEAESERTRLAGKLAIRSLTPAEAARLGGIIEDTSTSFIFQFLIKDNNYTIREALDVYSGCRRVLKEITDGQ